MKKKVIAILLCATMVMPTLVACGGKDSSSEAVVEEATEETSEEASEGCSDENFAALQEAYASLSEEVELVENYYMDNADIPQDDDVEETLAAAHEYMDQVGEIEQSEITDADAEELAQSMVDVANSLVTVAKALDIMAGNGTAEEATEDASAEGCSDENFAAIQDAYAELSSLQETVVNYYMENPDVEQDDEVEDVLNKAQEYLDEVGEIKQNEISDADAETIAQSMVDVANGLSMIAEAIAK